jgi:hypothetical protein
MSGPALTNDDWAGAFFGDADQLDLPLLMSWFGPDIDLRLANVPAITGREAVEATFAQFWTGIRGMRHVREQLVTDGDTAFQGSLVTYVRPDGLEVTMPVASHLRRDAAGMLDRLWIYIDLGPLYAD